ncbi:MAG: alkaline phosphatase family protein, partial [Gemmatimonadales bacterium]
MHITVSQFRVVLVRILRCGYPLLAMACLSACAATAPSANPSHPDPVVLLVSIDGFGADYLDPATTPHLSALADRGVRAEALIPSFPTKTFPNHYTIVTGLRPDHHGIVANNMWDPETESSYSLGNREAIQNPAWYGGTPIWVTAEQAGVATAPLFWPGSEAPIQGVRPRHWLPYNGSMTHKARIDWVLDRLSTGGTERVRFATLYFDDVDEAGHEFGPGSTEVAEAIARIDSSIGLLLESLRDRGLNGVNLIIVSDHGMSRLSQDRIIFLDDYIDPDSVRVVDWSPVLALWHDSTTEDAVYRALKGVHPHLHVYRRHEIPVELGFGTHPRVAPIIGLADPGWSIAVHDYYERNSERFDGGSHGYDQRSDEMRALFVAAGPGFRTGMVVPPFPNVDVYELIMALLDLPP